MTEVDYRQLVKKIEETFWPKKYVENWSDLIESPPPLDREFKLPSSLNLDELSKIMQTFEGLCLDVNTRGVFLSIPHGSIIF